MLLHYTVHVGVLLSEMFDETLHELERIAALVLTGHSTLDTDVLSFVDEEGLFQFVKHDLADLGFA